jgi:hypothetical protein
VNFISVDATVRLTAQPPGTVTREVDAHGGRQRRQPADPRLPRA